MAAQMVAELLFDRDDWPIDRCTMLYDVSDTSFADQVRSATVMAVGLWPVSSLAS